MGANLLAGSVWLGSPTVICQD